MNTQHAQSTSAVGNGAAAWNSKPTSLLPTQLCFATPTACSRAATSAVKHVACTLSCNMACSLTYSRTATSACAAGEYHLCPAPCPATSTQPQLRPHSTVPTEHLLFKRFSAACTAVHVFVHACHHGYAGLTPLWRLIFGGRWHEPSPPQCASQGFSGHLSTSQCCISPQRRPQVQRMRSALAWRTLARKQGHKEAVQAVELWMHAENKVCPGETSATSQAAAWPPGESRHQRKPRRCGRRKHLSHHCLVLF
jgi:hypothetical protein